MSCHPIQHQIINASGLAQRMCPKCFQIYYYSIRDEMQLYRLEKSMNQEGDE